ncbi:hypothetical protein IPZ58_05345 [Streptomyces roseoverticillatus]|uniref:hypothetical protein n=1 Tax=Streptomyces roseoverticillatus TaxID=66429 RepID=UPI001F3042E3|nr:hypothetical protein [Streptomyces roseoverticillatus]MCF3101000.1 hypothetical protein [Streptomyces roseoverticillatus]
MEGNALLTDTLTDECDSWMHPLSTTRTVAPKTNWLAARRRTIFESAIKTCGTRGVKVVAYELTTIYESPEPALDAIRAYVHEQEWTLVDTCTDREGMTAPAIRRGWLEARRLVAGGFVTGIVTVSRSAISTADKEYENELAWLETHRAFLAHLPQLRTPSR